MVFAVADSGWLPGDPLSWVMAALIVFVIVNVLAFSRRYLAGDRYQAQHLWGVAFLGGSVLILAFADHLFLFFTAWGISNLLLVRLMIHKPEWTAARKSGLLALKTFGLGLASLGAGFWLLASGAGSSSIRAILASAEATPLSDTTKFGLWLIAIAALTQSAAWPFQRWLVSSLNSPTPVSALMHAGLVNGGGFLLARFAPLYLREPLLLQVLFTIGLFTAILGTTWKLLQPDVKRMLACSTMGQMGFMIMQCGMGLFAPAISHLCWHGLFKAYLFLNTGSVVREERYRAGQVPLTLPTAIIAGLAGIIGAFAFGWISGLGVSLRDTRFIMTALAFMATAQLAAGLLQTSLAPWKLVAAPVLSLVAASLYGLSIRTIDSLLVPLNLMQPQPLNAVYGLGIALLALFWLAVNFQGLSRVSSSQWWKRIYVAALNGSQPHPDTVTASRTSYQY